MIRSRCNDLENPVKARFISGNKSEQELRSDGLFKAMMMKQRFVEISRLRSLQQPDQLVCFPPGCPLRHDADMRNIR